MSNLLQAIAPEIWHIQHPITMMGLRFSSRMTVVRMADGRLWLHSPVPISSELKAELDALGEVAFIVAPSKMHHLFVKSALRAFPNAALYGAPGLRAKRPDLTTMQELTPQIPPEMAKDFALVCVQGIPIGNETVWLHQASKTLILTDLCQFWQAPNMGGLARFYAWLTGVNQQFAVPRTVRLACKDKAAARASFQQIRQWRFQRVVMAHDAIITQDAEAQVARALVCFD